jgi:hypothetical protein
MKKFILPLVAFLVGVMAADKVKPMLGKLPLVGGLFGGSTVK